MNLGSDINNERLVIEQELFKIIRLIDESDYSYSKKKKLKEEAFKLFHERVQNYKGVPKFKNMTVEDIIALYEKFVNEGKDVERDI